MMGGINAEENSERTVQRSYGEREYNTSERKISD